MPSNHNAHHKKNQTSAAPAPGNGRTPPGEGDARLEDDYERQWHRAQERLLLYLRTCDFPAHVSLELALLGLNRARGKTVPGEDGDPASAAMSELFALLFAKDDSSGGGRPGQVQKKDPLLPSGVKAMPTLNRGSMVRAEHGRRWWAAILSRFSKKPLSARA